MSRESVWQRRHRRPPAGSANERYWLLGNAIRKHRFGEPLDREEMTALVRAAWSLINAELSGLDVEGHLREQGLEIESHLQHLARIDLFGDRVTEPSLAIARAKNNRFKLTVPTVEFFLAAGATVHEAAREAARVLGRKDAENVRRTYLKRRRRTRR